jgi:signal peptidase I
MSINSDHSAWWKSIFHNQKQAWLNMHSGSMSPLIPSGAQILVKFLEPPQIRAGDIVLFIEKNQLIAHRVLKVNLDQNQCLQGGDNAIVTSFIPFHNILGVVAKVKVEGKEVDLNTRTTIIFTRFLTRTQLGIAFLRRKWPKAAHLLHKVKIKLAHGIVMYLL